VAIDDGAEGSPGADRVIVGTAASVRDAGGARVDLVAILDPDRALARAGLHAGEQTLATWMEAAQWAGPRSDGGRVLVQTKRGGDAAVQALVRWEPVPFLLAEADRRAAAGMPSDAVLLRVSAGPDHSELPGVLEKVGASPVVTMSGDQGTVCLVSVALGEVARFGTQVRGLAAEGIVDRVEAEPHL
jgi:primosomal protein N'